MSNLCFFVPLYLYGSINVRLKEKKEKNSKLISIASVAFSRDDHLFIQNFNILSAFNLHNKLHVFTAIMKSVFVQLSKRGHYEEVQVVV